MVLIISDLKYKKIPNILLVYLFALSIMYYIFLYNNDLNFWFILLKTIYVTTIGFLLYMFSIWWAWDSKYLILISLFLPFQSINTLLWNIAIIVIWYLILEYFIFITKIFVSKNKKNLIKNIITSSKDKFEINLRNSGNSKKEIIYKFILSFLIFFTTIKIIVLTIQSSIFAFISNEQEIMQIILAYKWYAFILIALAYLCILKIIGLVRVFLSRKTIAIVFLCFILVSYFWYHNTSNALWMFYKIFTMHLFLYIIVKILIFWYKMSFEITEKYYINIKDLKVWDIIDKEHLKNVFWQHGRLEYVTERKLPINRRIKKMFIWKDINTFMANLTTPIDQNSKKKIQNLFYARNFLFKKFKDKKNLITTIKLVKTLSFAHYIFLWFILTYFFNDKIITLILERVIEQIFS